MYYVIYMHIKKIMNPNVLDIIFDKRNQKCGLLEYRSVKVARNLIYVGIVLMNYSEVNSYLNSMSLLLLQTMFVI